MADYEPSLATLRDAPSQLPGVEYQDITPIWEAGEKLTNGSTNTPVVSRTRFVANTLGPPVALPLTGESQRRRQYVVPTVGAFVQASGSVGAPCHHRL